MRTNASHNPLTKACIAKRKETDYHLNIEDHAMYSPHDAITGSVGCLAMDLILPEHFPRKHPNNFPVMIVSCQLKHRKQAFAFKEINYAMLGLKSQFQSNV